MAKNWQRWLPAGIVPAVIVTATVVGPTLAEASPQLPAKSAQELLEHVADSTDSAFSGTLEQSSELGLPELQSMGPGGGSTDGPAAALEFLTADHTAQVHVDGPDKARVQVQDRLGERNVIRNGDEVWYYDFREQEAAHAVRPADVNATDAPAAETYTPAAIAEKFLSKIDPSTEISVGDNARVAGRTAYELVLTPSTDDTLVGAVSLAVDAETGVPLSFTIAAQGQSEPAFSVAFSSIDFSAPDAGLFEFAPPAGTTVTEVPVKELRDHDMPDRDPGTEPTVLGEGWSSIVALPAGSASNAFTATPNSEDAAEAQALLQQAFVQVDGGRVLQTSLVTVFIADDGRVFAGAVSADQLIAASQQ
ncbi:LolA family protein [Arthrobacter sp. TMN-37]